MKIGVLVPDRGDRPDFLENCIRMIKNQTLNDVYIKLVDYVPTSDDVDITQRYRVGYEFFRGLGFDCVLLMENDDYYSSNYIQTIIDEWIKQGKPDILGTNYTLYYHIGLLKHETFVHHRRASAMNTLLKTDLNIEWPVDDEPYTDLHLWKQLKGITFEPNELISIGIKHNVGKTGGHYHGSKLERYKNTDPQMDFLRANMDDESFNFYKSVHEKIQSSFQ